MRVAVLIVAAGRGTRAGGPLPKQWQHLGPKRVIDWTLAAFAQHPQVDQTLVVVHPDDVALLPAGTDHAIGGATRAASVRAGLMALRDQGVDRVLIHDAARPCVSAQIISDVISALDHVDGAAPGVAITDALWVLDDDQITGTADRSTTVRAQTPQGFALPAILAAHQAGDDSAADDVELAVAQGLSVRMVPGHADNLKITRPEDFARASDILEPQMDIRVGNGFDVHSFTDGDHVTLCGVQIPHHKALTGHSDADVAMHALTDAIYGALADGDIGQHFPPSDPQWKGADSAVFLIHAIGRARARGYALGNADVTLICEAPKIGPHASAMAARLADILQVDPGQISVKATTSERLGFTGREEGIASLASCTLIHKGA